jgi:head-tail adaptor
MLPSNDLEYIRSSIELLLPDTCNILSVTRTADGFGGWTDTWGTATVGAACRVDPLKGLENITAEALRPFHPYIMTLAHDVTINEQSRVEWNGNTYNVTSVNVNSWQGCKRVALEIV